MITGITFCLIVTMANLVVGAFVGLTGVAGCRSLIHPFWDWARQRDWPLALVLLSFLVMQCMNRKQLF